MTRNHCLSQIHPYKSIPDSLTDYFQVPAFCMYHHFTYIIQDTHINNIYNSLNNLLRSKYTSDTSIYTSKLRFLDNYMMSTDWLDESNKYKLCEYVHGTTCEESDALKSFITQYTQNVQFLDKTCCDGRGFSITLL